MSADETRAAFLEALHVTHPAVAAEAMASGQQPDPAELAESSGLRAAAQAHADAARPYEEIAAEYLAETDPVRRQELAEELQPARSARAILAGSYPGSGVSAGAVI